MDELQPGKSDLPFEDDGPLPKGVIEHEWLLPDLFEPCESIDWDLGARCGSEERVIRFVPNNSGKAIYCARGHHHDFNGKTFIPAEEFGPGGVFYGILPPEFTPDETELRAKRWKISRHVKDALADRTRCADCQAEEFNSWDNADPAALWEWITAYDTELSAMIHDELRAQGGFALRDWYALTSPSLRKVIMNRLSMSMFAYDHGVPRKVANTIWYSLSLDARRFLQETLIFKICKKCNGAKGSKLPSRDDLIARYVNYYFDGSPAFAKADARWTTFQEILEALYDTNTEAV